MSHSNLTKESQMQENGLSTMKIILLARWKIYEKARASVDTRNRFLVVALILLEAVLFSLRPELPAGKILAGLAMVAAALWYVERILRDMSIKAIEQKFAQSELDLTRTSDDKEWVDAWIVMDHNAETSWATYSLSWIRKLEPWIWVVACIFVFLAS
jgi:hypothetical protein